MGLIENLQRETSTQIEEARGLKRLADEFSLTHETIAKAVGKAAVRFQYPPPAGLAGTGSGAALPPPLGDGACPRIADTAGG